VASEVWIAQAATFLTTAYVLQKRLDMADLLLAELPGHSPDQAFQTWGQRHYGAPLAEVALAAGDHERCLLLIRRMKEDQPAGESHEPQPRFAALRLERLEGLALARGGRLDEARRQFELVESGAELVENRSYLWRAAADLASLHLASGEQDMAREAATRAFVRLEECAASIPETSLRNSFLTQAATLIPGQLRRRPPRSSTADTEGLTAREVEIAVLVARGLSNRAIADELVLSVRTVETHVANATSKLGLNSRAQLAAWAVAHGHSRTAE
jgi:DNA-binding CsgD family transcriptional regulator